MAWPRTLLACAVAALLIAAWTPAAAQAGSRHQMVRTINFVRSLAHQPRVHYSRRLSRRAAAWARHLMSRGVLAHSSSATGEVIEWHTGTRPRVRRAVDSWLQSPGHRRVILSGRYRRAGAGRAVGYMNGRRTTIWVVRFARG